MTRRRIFLALLFLLSHSLAQEELRGGERDRPGDVETAWADLDSTKPAVREAARKKIEAQPFSTWKSRAIGETRPWASIEALLALCHACPLSVGPALRPHLCEGITTLRIEEMSAEQKLAAIRLTRLVCTRFGEPTEDERRQMIDLWSRFVPRQAEEKQSADQRQIARELKELLSLLGAGDVIKSGAWKLGGWENDETRMTNDDADSVKHAPHLITPGRRALNMARNS